MSMIKKRIGSLHGKPIVQLDNDEGGGLLRSEYWYRDGNLFYINDKGVISNIPNHLEEVYAKYVGNNYPSPILKEDFEYMWEHSVQNKLFPDPFSYGLIDRVPNSRVFAGRNIDPNNRRNIYLSAINDDGHISILKFQERPTGECGFVQRDHIRVLYSIDY